MIIMKTQQQQEQQRHQHTGSSTSSSSTLMVANSCCRSTSSFSGSSNSNNRKHGANNSMGSTNAEWSPHVSTLPEKSEIATSSSTTSCTTVAKTTTTASVAPNVESTGSTDAPTFSFRALSLQTPSSVFPLSFRAMSPTSAANVSLLLSQPIVKDNEEEDDDDEDDDAKKVKDDKNEHFHVQGRCTSPERIRALSPSPILFPWSVPTTRESRDHHHRPANVAIRAVSLEPKAPPSFDFLGGAPTAPTDPSSFDIPISATSTSIDDSCCTSNSSTSSSSSRPKRRRNSSFGEFDTSDEDDVERHQQRQDMLFDWNTPEVYPLHQDNQEEEEEQLRRRRQQQRQEEEDGPFSSLSNRISSMVSSSSLLSSTREETMTVPPRRHKRRRLHNRNKAMVSTDFDEILCQIGL